VPSDVKTSFDKNGFVVLPGLLADDIDDELLRALGRDFPTAEDFHSGTDPERNARFRDEFGGITPFPCSSSTLNLLAVHERLRALAEELLGTDNLRAYSIEFWAKYTGAADYEQAFHRDYLNHSVVVPDADAPPSQIEMFVYLSEVDEDLGPIALLPRRHAPDMPALPNWYPPTDNNHDRKQPHWTSPVGRPDWYDREHRAVGPAGTVIAYRVDTFHRGTNLERPGGARYTIHTNFRRADHDWIGRRAWADIAASDRAWKQFVIDATTKQLELFGFPPPGNEYWNATTRSGLGQRYPGIRPERWM
jgi:hypothetical protein